jgi:solute carrier family 39 (zinc transporter), member 1/2/3
MLLLPLKILAICLILLISLLVGLAPIRSHASNPAYKGSGLTEALASGIFLGAALFHMLPSAEAGFHSLFGNLHFPYANLLCALGFLLLLFLEQAILHLRKHTVSTSHTSLAYILTVVLAVHAFTEGAALGINTTMISTAIIFTAIIVHKGSESFALSASLIESKLTTSRMYQLFLLFALMTPIGIIIGSLASAWLQNRHIILAQAIFNAFAAGTFLYIATLHKVTHSTCHHIERDHFNEFLATLAGIAVMAIIAIWV